ncbi:hypothetical protein BpHYR1_018799 [Brachionus plicatilis]|uniref:MULE transposase domain-containing protein n=1 Tax=Brachionus plicatilis TaxID=10195 RepID=A0A3M7SVF9_BRAPC|nr:hypothetical protein BpHYR1_018799 [Brachionus plicatilis]
MRRKIDWLFLIKVNSMVELEFFMTQYPKTSSSYSNSNNCQICDKSDHKMSVLYPSCKCTDTCLTRYLFWKCKSTEQIVVKGINLHKSTTQNKEVRTLNIQGITAKFKKLIEELIFVKNISKPYKIYQKLLLDNNRDPQMPKLTQIQSFLKYRRSKNGDVNSIVGLEEFVAPKILKNNEQFLNDEPFYFGVDINDGSEDKHFHLCITSKTLLNNILYACTFHFDCTYKIVKYGFPLIVFGFTSIQRKLYPIVYFITSHEQEIDFDYFWRSLIQTCHKLNKDLINYVNYICIDADRACANSIKTNLENSKIIMCSFHLTPILSNSLQAS